jgi:predicted glutamine amidotransferase
MCLITYTPRKETIDYDKMKTAMHVNPHGFGIVFAYEGVLRYCRKPKEGFDYFVEAMKLVPDDAPVAIHFRMATHGDKGEDNQHPFPILTKDEHGIDLCMMHNGVIGGIHKNGSTKSDTLIYAEHILSPLLIKHPDLVDDPAFKLLVERDIGTGNKLLFLDGNGKCTIYNPESGSFDKKHEDMWYSNTYSFNEYHRGGGGHNQNFTGRHQNGGHGGVGGNYSEHWKNRQREHNHTSNSNSATTSGGSVVDLPPVKMTPVELALKLGSDFMLDI